MGLWTLLAVLYAVIAIFAIVMTYREQQKSGRKSPVFNAIGFVLCVFWPFMAAAVLHSRARHPA